MIVIAFYVFIIIGNWTVLEKAGVEGWKAIIPFYNLYCLAKIVFGNGWIFFLAIIPGISIIYYIIWRVFLAQCFGKGVGFTIGTVLLPFIFVPILGLGSSEYKGTM